MPSPGLVLLRWPWTPKHYVLRCLATRYLQVTGHGFIFIHWNLSITATSYDTSLSSRAHPGGSGPPGWALEDRESDRMRNYLSSVCINHVTQWATDNRLHYKGGRYWQVILYDHSDTHSHGSQTSRDVVVRRHTTEWIYLFVRGCPGWGLL